MIKKMYKNIISITYYFIYIPIHLFKYQSIFISFSYPSALEESNSGQSQKL